ncbi:acVLRF1 family peptidyl-tRNA hydrolase [Nocardioides zeicaulis]|uniref:AcVLRF1 family peptidyl-tRNA hydrolase n=1 Tax=Nocardioides zeicaulis TaxID=1776857 RepID=A0ABV6DWG9_9ACTN
MPVVLVPPARWERWVDNFAASHGATRLSVGEGALHGRAEDGSRFTARPPFSEAYVGEADAAALVRALDPPAAWGVLLVRKGGFAVARLAGEQVVEHKIGQRHVQGRTKAGGQSQQRFARRRDNQARQAYEAAADHAARILGGVRTVVTGGDHAAVDAVLEDPRLSGMVVVGPWLPVPDPRRAVLDAAVADAQALRVEVVNA